MPVAMSETEARAEIETLASAGSPPALTASQVAMCLRAAQRRDSAGKQPGETDYAPTWDIAAGVARAWLLKAGNTAGKYDAETGTAGTKLKRSQMHAQCMAQHQIWLQQVEPVTGRMLVYEDLAAAPEEPLDPLYNLDGNRLI